MKVNARTRCHELGPLDPDWFDVLTARTLTNEGNVSDQDDLCANQEGNFKPPFDKTEVDSQLFSTPRVFRHRCVVSPGFEDDQWLPKEQEKETLPWTATQSPYLFQTPKVGVPCAKHGGTEPQSQNSFDLLHTPQKSPVSYAKHISESLGAQIHPDISWTSSLNTPPAVPSTLILSKTDESPCPFVRKLFPSLSNASSDGAVSPKNTDITAPYKDAFSPETSQKPHNSPESSLNQCEGIWRQKLPDAIEDGEIRSTVASVLDGAENVLSIFFTNTGSALRKVKTNSNKRKLINPTKEHDYSSTDISTTNNATSSQQRTNDHEPEPLKSDTESAQLVKTPLSITDSGFTKKRRKFIYTVDTSKMQVQEKAKQSQKRDTSQRLLDFGHKVNVKKLEEAQDEASCCSKGESETKQENVSEKNLPSSVQANVQDLDISQLCRDFAEDFSQTSDHGKLSKVVEDTPLNGFSPSACLSAMKRAKQKAWQANSHQDHDGISNRRHVSANNLKFSVNEGTINDSGFQSAVSNSTDVTSFVLLNTEKNTQSDSGFKTDTHRTAYFLSTDTGSQITTSVDILQKNDTRAIQEGQTLDPVKELHKESTLIRSPRSEKGTVYNNHYVLLCGQVTDNLPEKTTFSLPSNCASGFKTASNKGIEISSANLKRAKRLFEESEINFTDQLNKSAHDSKEEIGVSHGTMNNTVSNSKQSRKTLVDATCQLTASEKADVTELCTLLEEADTQFEFTQFKAAKVKQHCEDSATPLQKVDKELDPDFLMGIDFDDSFTSDADKQPEITEKISSVSDGKTNYDTSKVTGKSLGTSFSSALRKESSSPKDVSSSLKHLSEGSSSISSSEPQNLYPAGYNEINKQENDNHLMPCAEFRTAGGNVLRVSEKHLSKARALFEDLEENVAYEKLASKQSSEHAEETEQAQIASISDVTKSFKNEKMDTTTCPSGFQLASGKGISVTANHMKAADLFFKDCSVMENNTGMAGEHKGIEPITGSVSHKKNLLYLENMQGIKDGFTEEPVKKFENCKVGPATHVSNVVLHTVETCSLGFKNTSAFTNAVSFHVNPSVTVMAIPSTSYTTSKNIGSTAINELGNNDGFCTANGKKVSVSADGLKKAESLLHAIHSFDDTNNPIQQTGEALRTGHLNKQIHAAPLKNCGFQTASGKGVVISSAALKKAKSLLSECEAFEENLSVKPTHFQAPVTSPPHRNSGFLAASGKPVALSAEALQKAKALFSDINCSADFPVVSYTGNCDKKQDNADNKTNKIHYGLMTGGGATVHVSQKNLLKAKILTKEFDNDSVSAKTTEDTDFFKGCDFIDGNDGMSVKYNTSVKLVCESGIGNKKHLKFKPDKKVEMNSSVNPGSGCAELENVNLGLAVNQENGLLLDDVKINNGVFKKAPCSTNAASIHRHPSLMAKPPSSPPSTTLKNICSSAFNELHSDGGFCTVSSKNVSVSDDAVTKPKSFFNDRAAMEDTCKQLKHNEGALPLPSGGFQTASGKGVIISAAALENAKTLLSECEGVHDKTSVKLTHSKKPVPDSGFHATSDKPVTFSSEAQWAEALCSGINFSAEMPAAYEEGKTDRPEGVMNDRKVFKYNNSLHPNVTRPHRNEFVENRLQEIPTKPLPPGENRLAHSKISSFVPPFNKKAGTVACKDTVRKDNMRAPAFIPPFKKQRTIVQESSFEARQDQHHHRSATTSNSNTYVPPTKKTQITTDVTDNKSKVDTQTMALADTKDDNLNIDQNRPVDCGSEDFSAEAPCVEDTSTNTFPNLENLELARDMQDMRIRKKKRQTIRPLPGSLFLTKTSGLYGLGVQQHVTEVTSETAENFRFSLLQFLKQEAFIDNGGVQLGDGGWLITSKDGTAGKEEFYRALCDTPGVDPKLISQAWVYNHYRWIVWKQASMERSFPEIMGSLCLTPEQVLLQLKYRYDIEVDNSRRPALRKIMERDDTAAKTLVLCVCGVVSRGDSLNKQGRNDTKTPQSSEIKIEKPSAVVWLTDGWYGIKAQLDEPLTAMLHNGRVAVGSKLIIHGAQLVGSQDACSPLEAPESLMLKVCANSTRPARWDTKLGFYKDPRPFLLPVACLYGNGGPVGCVDIIVLRSYPIQWMERKPDGGVVFRSDRAEEKEMRRYNSQKQKAMEILFAKIQAEFEQEKCTKPQHRRRTLSRQDIASLHDGEELYEVVGDDPTYFEAYLSGQQLETLHTYRCSLMEKKQAELQDRYRHALEAEDSEGSCPKRDVAPVWRLCIADSMDLCGRVYQLNLWRPSSDLQSVLKEGFRYKVFNLTTSDGKKRSGYETIQLTGTKKTQFQDLEASQEWLFARFQHRVSASFVDLQNPEFQPLCGEVDLTGYVVSVIDEQGSSPAFYLADGKMNFVKVRCFSSFSHSGLEDVVKPHMLLALSNLQLRGQSTSPTPVVYAGDLTIFSTNPKEVHLQESLSQLRNLVQDYCLVINHTKLSLLPIVCLDTTKKMSYSESTICPDIENSGVTQSTEHNGDDKNSKCVRERVLKEVGLTSTTFIGPALPPQSGTRKSHIDDTLSEFYKELEEIDIPDGATGNPGKEPPTSRKTSDRRNTQDVSQEMTFNINYSEETDRYQKSNGQKMPSWPHWHQNEPYYNRRTKPGLEQRSDRAAASQNQWHYPQSLNSPSNPRFHRPPFHLPPPQLVFPNPNNPPPHMNPNWRDSGISNQYRGEPHFSTFPSFPPQNVSSHPSQGNYGDSKHPLDRDERGYVQTENVNVGRHRDREDEWSQFGKDYDWRQRFGTENKQWEQQQTRLPPDSTRSSASLVLILMRGLPGSGKSTLARELLSTGPSGLILSADDYFSNKDGYRYEPGFLGAAHEWTQNRARDAMHHGRSPIIIDNTNIQAWEMKPYVKMALERGYKVEFFEPDTSWKFDPYELEKRNKHGVPHEKIAQMLDRFSFPISIDIVMRSLEPRHVNQRH
ncbi:Breast cancer type 2 susceptibility protein Fanconi anemia group D1 protein [Channa argus]|uniref:Breast cancer type 2 susceptibility protein Fanconi anemia group D1 protein n=1 Tax=Channa argus TaxID=215402 RepID=A0A6G1PSJ7_CHAAH|nr:Breast cancer type 2 susceptibility protein Fanconi anemia group D1 protein [Channa argus]